MLDWIRDNYSVVSLLSNLGMLVVWIAYLQLFLASYRRQTRPKILINAGAGRKLDARCLLSNMSSVPIYIESLIATLETREERWICPVTDMEQLTQDQDPSDLRQMTRQGPLMPGAVMDVGSFRELISRVVQETGCTADSEEGFPDGLTTFEIQAIADFGPDDLLVGAKRRFDLMKRNGSWVLGPQTPYTVQIRSKRERRRIRRLLEENR